MPDEPYFQVKKLKNMHYLIPLLHNFTGKITELNNFENIRYLSDNFVIFYLLWRSLIDPKLFYFSKNVQYI